MPMTAEEAESLGPTLARRAWALEAANRLVSDWTGQATNALVARTTAVIQLAEFLLAQDQQAAPAVSPANLVGPGIPTPHLHRASCHGPAGELTCGYPPGPGI